MKVLPRTQFGDPVLRAKAKPVPPSFLKTPAFRTLVRQMFHTMSQANGVGLAAPQIGRSLQLAVIRVTPERLDNISAPALRRIVVNPKITWRSKGVAQDWEGCLSFPGVRGKVPRWLAIEVRYMNEKGKWVKERHRGFAARVFQHEIDHLNGIVYVDRMKDMKTLMTHQEFLKRIA